MTVTKRHPGTDAVWFIKLQEGGSKVATKLKNLKVRKVDFVDEGANPDANILLFKRRDVGKGELGEGYGRNKEGFWKRLVSVIREAAEMMPERAGDAVEGIQKENSLSFNEKLNEAKGRKVADEIWELCYALQSSICSILADGNLDSVGAAAAMKESLGEFHAVAEESVTSWASGNVAGIEKKDGGVTNEGLGAVSQAGVRLEGSAQMVGETSRSGDGEGIGTRKKREMEGEEEEMKIDKSRLTPGELAFLESIEKRYGTGDVATGMQGQQADVAAAQQPPEGQVTKSAQPETLAQAVAPQASAHPMDAEDIYKGLHPAVRAELEELKKFREDVEERELTEVARKYAIIGKKEEELVPMLKGLKAAGGTAYQDMVAVLDQAVDTVEKSGIFSEIGKAGSQGIGIGTAETKISGIAKNYMEKDPSLSYDRAVAKAWEDNPDILDEYEKEAGF